MKASTVIWFFLAAAVAVSSGCGGEGPGIAGTDLPVYADLTADDAAGPADVKNDVAMPPDDGALKDAGTDQGAPDAGDAQDVQPPKDPGVDKGTADPGSDPGIDVSVDSENDVPPDQGPDVSDALDAGPQDSGPVVPKPCDPCQDDGDCGDVGLCMDLDLSVFVCGMHCGPGQACPTGLLCEVAPTSQGSVAAQCIPADICECNDALEGQTHACKKTTLSGTCHGVETCTSGKWAPCDAFVPVEEECNGKDDDCDGDTDEGFGTITCGLGICQHSVPACDANGPAPCDPLEGAQDSDLPDTDGVDSDCDGIDGTEALSVFVSATTGLDSNPGTKDQPKRTITAGIETAKNQGKRDVLVSEGLYQESPQFEGGVNVHAGYRAYEGWKRYKSSMADVVGGSVGATAVGIDVPTVVTRLHIRAADATDPGGHSIGLWLSKTTSDMVFEECEIQAGWAQDGLNGAKGDAASPGGNGGKGANGCENGGVVCGHCGQPASGAGGVSECGSTGGTGGAPGHGDNNGSAGGGGCCTDTAGAGGQGGAVEKAGKKGADATGKGADGQNGPGGNAVLVVAEAGISTAGGEDGTSGDPGNGGGGGGGGGGGKGFCPDYGGAGGGGGAGGCGGGGGKGGQAGGSSIAVASYDSGAIFKDCKLTTSGGGDGGSGGSGALGAQGGQGGAGGSGHEKSGSGGAGGNGSAGGVGGHGGGGPGGSDVGLACGGSLVPTLLACTFDIKFGGAGGKGQGNPGQDGLSAQTLGCAQ